MSLYLIFLGVTSHVRFSEFSSARPLSKQNTERIHPDYSKLGRAGTEPSKKIAWFMVINYSMTMYDVIKCVYVYGHLFVHLTRLYTLLDSSTSGNEIGFAGTPASKKFFGNEINSSGNSFPKTRIPTAARKQHPGAPGESRSDLFEGQH